MLYTYVHSIKFHVNLWRMFICHEIYHKFMSTYHSEKKNELRKKVKFVAKIFWLIKKKKRIARIFPKKMKKFIAENEWKKISERKRMERKKEKERRRRMQEYYFNENEKFAANKIFKERVWISLFSITFDEQIIVFFFSKLSIRMNEVTKEG